MDRYKKTSLKFGGNLGLGRNIRAAEINSSRALNRDSKFNQQRCMKDKNECRQMEISRSITRIPQPGKSELKAPECRKAMLQKWKEEKQLKTKLQMLNKKPVFKTGVGAPSIPVFTSFGNKESFASSKSSSSKSSNSSAMNGKTSITKVQTTSAFAKTSESRFLRKPEQIQTSSTFMKTSESRILRKPEQVQTPSTFLKTTESRFLKKPGQVHSSSIARFPSKIQPPKTTKLMQSSVPKGIPNKISDSKNKMQRPVKTFTGVSKLVAPRKTTESKVETKSVKNGTVPAHDVTFSCEISHIEAPEKEKTFVFGAETSFAGLEDGLWGIYQKMQAGERTSTPKRKEFELLQDKDALKSELTEKISRDESQNMDTKNEDDTCREDALKSELIQEVSKGESQNLDTKDEDDAYQAEALKSELTQEVSKGELQNLDTKDDACRESTPCLPEIKVAEKYKSNSSVETLPKDLSDEQSQDLLKKSGLNMASIEDGETGLYTKCSMSNEKNSGLSSLKSTESLANNEEKNTSDIIETNPIVSDSKSLKDNNIGNNEILEHSENKLGSESKIMPGVETENIGKVSLSPFKENENLDEVLSCFSKLGVANDGKDSSKRALQNLTNKIESGRLQKQKNVEVNASDSEREDAHWMTKTTFAEKELEKVSCNQSSTRDTYITLRSNRRKEILESISETMESSSPPKPLRRKAALPKDFTPRRSMRLKSRVSMLAETEEDLFNVRMSLCESSPDVAEVSKSNTNGAAFDFENLNLEDVLEQHSGRTRMSIRNAPKVSLLYTPQQKDRVTSSRKSIKGDLMCFTPEE